MRLEVLAQDWSSGPQTHQFLPRVSLSWIQAALLGCSVTPVCPAAPESGLYNCLIYLLMDARAPLERVSHFQAGLRVLEFSKKREVLFFPLCVVNVFLSATVSVQFSSQRGRSPHLTLPSNI